MSNQGAPISFPAPPPTAQQQQMPTIACPVCGSVRVMVPNIVAKQAVLLGGKTIVADCPVCALVKVLQDIAPFLDEIEVRMDKIDPKVEEAADGLQPSG